MTLCNKNIKCHSSHYNTMVKLLLNSFVSIYLTGWLFKAFRHFNEAQGPV